MPPPSAGATARLEWVPPTDAAATGRASTPVRRAAHSRAGDRGARAAVRGLLVVGIIRWRSFGLLLAGVAANAVFSAFAFGRWRFRLSAFGFRLSAFGFAIDSGSADPVRWCPAAACRGVASTVPGGLLDRLLCRAVMSPLPPGLASVAVRAGFSRSGADVVSLTLSECLIRGHSWRRSARVIGARVIGAGGYPLSAISILACLLSPACLFWARLFWAPSDWAALCSCRTRWRGLRRCGFPSALFTHRAAGVERSLCLSRSLELAQPRSWPSERIDSYLNCCIPSEPTPSELLCIDFTADFIASILLHRSHRIDFVASASACCSGGRIESGVPFESCRARPVVAVLPSCFEMGPPAQASRPNSAQASSAQASSAQASRRRAVQPPAARPPAPPISTDLQMEHTQRQGDPSCGNPRCGGQGCTAQTCIAQTCIAQTCARHSTDGAPAGPADTLRV
jgi:hypothetical protein